MPDPKKSAREFAANLLAFLGGSVVLGVLVTAGVTPALVVTGATASAGVGLFEGLPSYLKIGQPMETTNIYATGADDQPVLLASFFDQNREEVEWDAVSQYLKDAAVSAEDPRFYEHGGVDMAGTIRAVMATYIGGDTQGGSTITQQYVKNVLVQQCETKAQSTEELDECADEATTSSGIEGVARKLKEMRFAVGVEDEYAKDDILLGYLNIATFGARTYGVQAAAKYYFGVNAADVTIEQAATLIAILNNPSNLRIDQPDNEVNGEADGYAVTKERRDYVIDKMLEEGKISQEEHDAAVDAPITPAITPPSTGCSTAGGSAYFCDYVTRIILNDETFGETPDERAQLLRRGGLDIYTTLDLALQAPAEASVAEYMPQALATTELGAAAVTVEPGTGRVLAMTQNKTYTNDAALAETGDEYTAINYNTDYAYGGSSGFQVGSSYKIFALVEWLEQGHSLYETVNASRRTFTEFTDTCDGGSTWTGQYNPQNYDGSSASSITPYQATKRSVNTAFIAMAEELDLCEIKNTAEALGVHRADGGDLVEWPSAVLGTNEIAPISMASAFAAIAAEGVACDPVAIDRIVGPDGEEMDVPDADCRQAITPEVANATAYAMQSVMEPGGTGANAAVSGADLFGKTGTSDNAYDTWITAGTTNAVTSLWVGNVEANPDTGEKTSMYDAIVNHGYSGYQAKYPVWSGIGEAMVSLYGGDPFPEPDNDYVRTPRVSVPDVTGDAVAAATAELEAAGFSVTVGASVESEIAAGLVARTDPGGGASVSRGATVTIHPSSGTATTTTPPDEPDDGGGQGDGDGGEEGGDGGDQGGGVDIDPGLGED
ncbi:transglycosylase domain-containing protein [Okibacterium endophyticum]